MDKISAKQMVGKIIVSEESGKRFGIAGDVVFISETGELMSIVVSQATKQISELGLQEDEKGRVTIPFTAVKSIGDFIIISEKNIQ